MKKFKILIICFILLSLIFSFLFFNGYSFLHIRKEPKDGQIKVACVGDSITYGHGLSSWHKNNYPAVLQQLLGDDYNVQNFGVSLATVQKTADFPYIEKNSYKPSIEYDADILIFMLGSNDTKPYNWTDSDSFKKEYVELLDTYTNQNSDLDVYVCTLSNVFYKDVNQTTGTSSFDVQDDIIDEINIIIKDVAKEKGYKLIDINSLTAEHREWYPFDYVHPNVDGAKAIAEEIYENIK